MMRFMSSGVVLGLLGVFAAVKTDDDPPVGKHCYKLQRRPPCLPHPDCSPLANPANGGLSTDYVTYETTVTLSCDDGYTPYGDTTTKCQDGGVWSNLLAVCKKDCSTLANPANGGLSTDYVTYETTVTLSCDDGYTPKGDTTTKCQDDGVWSNLLAECKKDCSPLSNPANGGLSTDYVTYETTVTLACDDGYTPNGDTTTKCQDDGVWSNLLAECKKDCSPLANPANGGLSTDYVTYETTVTLACDDGYTPNGDTTSKCQDGGVWSNLLAECKKDCSPLANPANGGLSTDYVTYETTVTLACDDGYTPNGDTTTKCQDGGVWSNLLAECKKDCSPLANPANGGLSTDYVTYETTVTLACDDGYTPNGDTTTKCQDDGVWSNMLAVCKKDCSPLANPANGGLSTDYVTYETTVTLACDDGYTPNGDTTTKCQDGGVWSNLLAECKKDCSPLANPANGGLSTDFVTYETTVTLACDDGFTPYGDTTTKCQDGGVWSNLLAECKKDCSPLANPANGGLSTDYVTYETTVTLACDDGYTPNGDTTTKCQDGGVWSNLLAVCKKDCSPLVTPASGSLSTDSVTYDTTVTLFCDDGYTPDGDTTTICQDGGVWSNLLAVCKQDNKGNHKISDGFEILPDHTSGCGVIPLQYQPDPDLYA